MLSTILASAMIFIGQATKYAHEMLVAAPFDLELAADTALGMNARGQLRAALDVLKQQRKGAEGAAARRLEAEIRAAENRLKQLDAELDSRTQRLRDLREASIKNVRQK